MLRAVCATLGPTQSGTFSLRMARWFQDFRDVLVLAWIVSWFRLGTHSCLCWTEYFLQMDRLGVLGGWLLARALMCKTTRHSPKEMICPFHGESASAMRTQLQPHLQMLFRYQKTLMSLALPHVLPLSMNSFHPRFLREHPTLPQHLPRGP